ncbi:hypothetical protein EYB25_005762 [Talaromyces marneffei]|nr:hypothetical protein EYB25_005762 [Talaromyces marneffei]
MSSLRAQVKHHKRRAEQWQRWCAGLSAQNMAPPIAQVVRQQNDAPSTPASARTQIMGHNVPNSSVVASTASNSSPIPPVLSREVSGTHSESNDGDQSRIIRVKDEPLSTGPLEGSSLGQEIFPAASEDLDEVGDAVTTPRSRRFAVFEDGVYRLQQEGPITTPSFQSGERRAFQPKDTNQINHFRTPQEASSTPKCASAT